VVPVGELLKIVVLINFQLVLYRVHTPAPHISVCSSLVSCQGLTTSHTLTLMLAILVKYHIVPLFGIKVQCRIAPQVMTGLKWAFHDNCWGWCQDDDWCTKTINV